MRSAMAMLLFLLTMTATLAEDAKEPDPSQRFTAFINALKAKDMNATMACVAKLRKVEGIDVEGYVKEKMAQHMKRLATGDDAVPVKHEIDGNCAVVVFKDIGPDERFDYDPCYLIQQDGRWGVLPRMTDPTDRTVELSNDEWKRLAKLAHGSDMEQKTLREAK